MLPVLRNSRNLKNVFGLDDLLLGLLLIECLLLNVLTVRFRDVTLKVKHLIEIFGEIMFFDELSLSPYL